MASYPAQGSFGAAWAGNVYHALLQMIVPNHLIGNGWSQDYTL